MESAVDDPLSDYHDRGILNTNTYDATVLPMPDGRLYLLGSTYGSLVIQPLSDPVDGLRSAARHRRPHAALGRSRHRSPSALWHDGQLWLLYTCGGYNKADYAVGALRFLGGDPLNPASWQKLPGPLFTQLPAARVWCAGAAAAFTSPDGKEDWFAYSDYNAYNAAERTRRRPAYDHGSTDHLARRRHARPRPTRRAGGRSPAAFRRPYRQQNSSGTPPRNKP